MVYRGGLENRFPRKRDGGSNPSLSANQFNMQDWVWIIIWVAVVGGVFAWLWRTGQLERFSEYVRQTREELKKCTWPTRDELKGSTIVVFISILLIGLFTVIVDQVFFRAYILFKL